MQAEERTLVEAGVDALALKPAEVDISHATVLDGDLGVIVDYEGHDHLPESSTLAELAHDRPVRLTVPVRADGFDPLGENDHYDQLPADVSLVLVAGNPAYLTAAERERAIAPRLRAAVERFPGAWVGTEGLERLALTVGGTQFELLSPTTERDLRALRAAGHDGEFAVYAPIVVATDDGTILDAVGPYAARRTSVREALPVGAATDNDATGRAREVLSAAVHDYALVGDNETVRTRIASLRDAGADQVVCYPARTPPPLA